MNDEAKNEVLAELDGVMHQADQVKLDRINDTVSASEVSISWVAAIAKAESDGLVTTAQAEAITSWAASISRQYMRRREH